MRQSNSFSFNMQKEIKVQVGQDLKDPAECSFILVDFLVPDEAVAKVCSNTGDSFQNLLVLPGSHHASIHQSTS